MQTTNEQVAQAIADAAIAASDAVSCKFVGRTMTSQDWLSVWGIESDAEQACISASKVGPQWSRDEYRKQSSLHSAFAAAAWEQAA